MTGTRAMPIWLTGLGVLLLVTGFFEYRRHVVMNGRIAGLEVEVAVLRAQLDDLRRQRYPARSPVYFDAAGWSQDRLTPSGGLIPAPKAFPDRVTYPGSTDRLHAPSPDR